MNESAALLLVEQQTKPDERLPELIRELAGTFQLDAYLCRQRLVGQGLAHLASGKPEFLAKISPLLKSVQVPHWIVAPATPRFSPQRILSLSISQNQVQFNGAKTTVTIPDGSELLAVFADLSGHLAKQSVKQLLSSHAYRGLDNIAHLSEQKRLKTILQGQPVLDLYLLDRQRTISAGIRFFPGKFDPKGLGELATLSSRQNLQRILQLMRERAGEFHLFSEFGLANLPGCRLFTENPEHPDTLRKNLLSLTRYGWLMGDLLQSQTASPQPAGESSAAMATAATLLSPPLAAALGELGQTTPLDQVFHEQQAEAQQTARPAAAAEPDGALLPPPPATRSTGFLQHPVSWLAPIAPIIFATVLGFGAKLFGPFQGLFQQAVHSGALALAGAGLAGWYGFLCLRLKRRVENTPTSRIRSLAMGMVEVKGKAIRSYALVSPMTQLPCVFYRLTKYKRANNNEWRLSHVTSSGGVPFLLDDGTGRVEIDPAGCRVSARTRTEGSDGVGGLIGYCSESDEKWVEEVIVEGTLLYVLGFAALKPRQGPTLAERKVAALRKLKQDPASLSKYDRNGDGRIDQDEWDAARSAVEEDVLRTELDRNHKRKKQEEQIMIGKRPGYPLIVSETHSEQQLTAHYLLYSIPLFILAGLATGLAFYQLFYYLHG